MAMLLVVVIFTFVLSAILPDVVTEAVHDTLLEGALEITTISPLEAALSTHFIWMPLSGVLTAIGPEVNTISFFYSVQEIAVIVASITPNLDAFAILFIVVCALRLIVYSLQIILDIEA